MALSPRRVEALVKGATCDWCGGLVAVAFFRQRGAWKRLLRPMRVQVIYACTSHVDRAQEDNRARFSDVDTAQGGRTEGLRD